MIAQVNGDPKETVYGYDPRSAGRDATALGHGDGGIWDLIGGPGVTDSTTATVADAAHTPYSPP